MRIARQKDDALIPDAQFGVRNFFELIVNATLSIAEGVMGRKKAHKHLPLIGTLVFFILFNNLIGLLVFLSINAHYWFIKALTESYRLVPPLNVKFDNSLMEQLIQMAGNMFVIALQVGAPVIAAMLLTSVAFGLVARTVPQMNVFIVAMPLKIGVGLLFIGFGLPFFSTFLKSIFGDLGQNIILMLKAMS